MSDTRTEVYLKQRFSVITKYDLTDSIGNPIYHVKGSIGGFSFNITALDDTPIATIKKKVSIIPTYNVTLANGNTIFLKKKIAITKQEFRGTYNNQEFLISGNFIAFDCDVSIDGTRIGTIKKEFLHVTDTYKTRALDPKWFDVMAIATVIVDNACHNNKGK